MKFTMENIVLAAASLYLAIRGGQEFYNLAKRKFIQDYLLLKRAHQYRKNPEALDYHLFHIGQILLSENKARKAAIVLERVYKVNPEYPLLNYLLGVAYLQMAQVDRAWMHLNSESTRFPDHPMLHFFLAKCYNTMGKPEQALEELNRSIELNPYYYPAYLFGLELFQRLSVEPRAEWEFFHHAEKMQCLIKPIWLRMAELEKQFMSEEECKSRETLYRSLEESWQETAKTKERVVSAIKEKHFFQAENLLISALRINPHDNQLYQMYDQLLIMQRKFGPALRFYQNEQQRIIPNPLEATLRLTDYFVFNKNYQQALELMLQTFQKYSNAKFLHYPLCLLYNWLNEPQEALKHLAQAISFDRGIKKLAKNNPDLENLKQQDEFQQLMRKT